MIQTPAQETAIAITAIVSIFVVAPIAFAFARMMWKRASELPRPKQLETDQLQRRLDHLQTSVEAMAIEVERISEGQRFVTKILSDKDRPSLGAGSEKRGT